MKTSERWVSLTLSLKPVEHCIQRSSCSESTARSSKTLYSHGLLASVSAPMSLSPSAISHFQWARQGAEARLATPTPWGSIRLSALEHIRCRAKRERESVLELQSFTITWYNEVTLGSETALQYVCMYQHEFKKAVIITRCANVCYQLTKGSSLLTVPYII